MTTLLSMNQSLNLHSLFVTDISGSVTMFIVLSLILFFLIMAKMRMPNVAIIILLLLYFLIMGVVLEANSLLILAVLGMAIFLSTAIVKMFS